MTKDGLLDRNSYLLGLLDRKPWVGLTDDEIYQGLLRSPYALQNAGAWREGVTWAEEILKRKNYE